MRRQFSIVIVITLALGIGANTAIFSLVHDVLLRPLAFAAPDRLVALWEMHPEIKRLPASIPDFEDWRRESRSFEQIAAYSFAGSQNFALTGAGDPVEIQGALASANLFPMLGVQPIEGRTYRHDENAVAVISERLWRGRFASAANPNITLNGETFPVVGVVPQAKAFPAWCDVWMPMSRFSDYAKATRKFHMVEVVGRLRPGVPLSQARAEIDGIQRRLQQAYPATNKSIDARMAPLAEDLAGDQRLVLLILFGAVGFVLLIACANVANLLLARAVARQRDMAIRTALGASRRALVGLCIKENLALSLAGGTAGAIVGLAFAGFARVNASVVLFALAISVLTGVLVSVAPALRASSADVNGVLTAGGRALAGHAGRKFSRVLVTAEIALAVVVLSGAGLLVRSLRHLLHIDPGFAVDNVLAVKLSLQPTRYTPAQGVEFHKRLLAQIAALPGVESAAVVNVPPMSDQVPNRSRFGVEGAPPPESGSYPVALVHIVSPDYFKTLRIPLRGGRLLGESDAGKSTFLINETLARRFFPGQDPVGRRLVLGVVAPDKPSTFAIAGVVGDVHNVGLDMDVEPEIYAAFYPASATVLARTKVDPMSLAAAVRREVAAADPGLPISRIGTLEQFVDASLARRRFAVRTLGLFSGIALLLAAVGVYGLIAYAANRRVREIGLRVALGARKVDILGMVLREGFLLALAGVAIGLALAVVVTRAMLTMLSGVTATDPVTLGAVSAVLLVVALAASYLPARKATRVDPQVALREA